MIVMKGSITPVGFSGGKSQTLSYCVKLIRSNLCTVACHVKPHCTKNSIFSFDFAFTEGLYTGVTHSFSLYVTHN